MPNSNRQETLREEDFYRIRNGFDDANPLIRVFISEQSFVNQHLTQLLNRPIKTVVGRCPSLGEESVWVIDVEGNEIIEPFPHVPRTTSSHEMQEIFLTFIARLGDHFKTDHVTVKKSIKNAAVAQSDIQGRHRPPRPWQVIHDSNQLHARIQFIPRSTQFRS